MIQPSVDQNQIVSKTRELCQIILSQPGFIDSRKDIHAFLDDDTAQELYREVSQRGRELEQAQLEGKAPSETELEAFEKQRFAFLENPVARNFIQAQQMMNEVQEIVNTCLNRSFELGRVPTEDELAEARNSCGCGSGCGCADS